MKFSDDFQTRIEELIHLTWNIFQQKVWNELLKLNKEASMQLHYSYILQESIPLIIFEKNESIIVELESWVKINNSNKEIDLLITWKKWDIEYKIAIEMKFYKKLASSGKSRWASDIFKKDVYEDLQLLEKYKTFNHCDKWIELIITDYEWFINPKNKLTKSWDYDISQWAKWGSKIYNTPIWWKEVNINLYNNYTFNWIKNWKFYFCIIK